MTYKFSKNMHYMIKLVANYCKILKNKYFAICIIFQCVII